MDDRLNSSVERALHIYAERKRKQEQEEYERQQAIRNAAALEAQRGQVEEKKATIGQLMDELLFPDISKGVDAYDGTEMLNDMGRLRSIAESIPGMDMLTFTTMLQFVANRRYMMLLFRDQPNALGRPERKAEPQADQGDEPGLVYEGEGPQIDEVDTQGTEDNPNPGGNHDDEGKEW